MGLFEKKIETLKEEVWKRGETVDFLIDDFKKSTGERDFRDFVKAVENAETEQFESLVALFTNVDIALEESPEHGVTIDEFVYWNFFTDTDHFEKNLDCDGYDLEIDVPFFKFSKEEGWKWFKDNYVSRTEENLILIAVEIGEIEDLEKDLLVWTAEVLA